MLIKALLFTFQNPIPTPLTSSGTTGSVTEIQNRKFKIENSKLFFIFVAELGVP
jgi:hypothetical protein